MRDTRQWNSGPNTSPGPQPGASACCWMLAFRPCSFLRCFGHIAAGSLTTSRKKAPFLKLRAAVQRVEACERLRGWGWWRLASPTAFFKVLRLFAALVRLFQDFSGARHRLVGVGSQAHAERRSHSQDMVRLFGWSGLQVPGLVLQLLKSTTQAQMGAAFSTAVKFRVCG